MSLIKTAALALSLNQPILSEPPVTAPIFWAQEFKSNATGYITYDGDTFSVKLADNTIRTIRLCGIDTPEVNHYGVSAQPYAFQAKTLTRAAIFKQPLNVTILGLDRYGRSVANVNTSTGSLQAQLLNSGLAYRFNGTVKCGSDTDVILNSAERSAKELKLNLFSGDKFTYPWMWRHLYFKPRTKPTVPKLPYLVASAAG